jgi:hypothetical protein
MRLLDKTYKNHKIYRYEGNSVIDAVVLAVPLDSENPAGQNFEYDSLSASVTQFGYLTKLIKTIKSIGMKGIL